MSNCHRHAHGCIELSETLGPLVMLFDYPPFLGGLFLVQHATVVFLPHEYELLQFVVPLPSGLQLPHVPKYHFESHFFPKRVNKVS